MVDLLTQVSPILVHLLVASGPGFFGGLQSVPGVSHCVVLMPPALRQCYCVREPLASNHDLTGLIVPSSALHVYEHLEDLTFVQWRRSSAHDYPLR